MSGRGIGEEGARGAEWNRNRVSGERNERREGGRETGVSDVKRRKMQ